MDGVSSRVSLWLQAEEMFLLTGWKAFLKTGVGAVKAPLVTDREE